MSRADVIAGVLAEHCNHHNNGGHRICRCGHRLPTTSTSRVTLDRAHRAHVAAVLAAAEPAAEQAHAAAPTEAQVLAEVQRVIGAYFDLDADSTDDDALPEPEDVWRFHRDIKATLTPADHEATP